MNPGRTGRAEGGRGLSGLAVAAVTAVLSGVSVFVNSYGVHAVRSPAVYTTAKNLVAFALLGTGALAAAAWRRRSPACERFVGPPAPGPRRAGGPGGLRPLQWLGLAYVGVVGGGIAFVLFFEGLARTTATPAAFVRDSLVIFVAALGVPFLHERVSGWNLAAIGVLVGGEVALSRGIGHIDLGAGSALVLASTLLWAVEVVVARRLLTEVVAPGTLSVVRMGVGAVTLCVYLAVTGALGSLGALDAGQVGWVLLTGLLLAGYVGTWMTALSRARALDVTSVLVASALVTALLGAVAGTQPLVPELAGLALIALGTALAVRAAPRRVPA
ncbi:MAG: DMT family transporter [Acidimicrobiales bacterium]